MSAAPRREKVGEYERGGTEDRKRELVFAGLFSESEEGGAGRR